MDFIQQCFEKGMTEDDGGFDLSCIRPTLRSTFSLAFLRRMKNLQNEQDQVYEALEQYQAPLREITGGDRLLPQAGGGPDEELVILTTLLSSERFGAKDCHGLGKYHLGGVLASVRCWVAVGAVVGSAACDLPKLRISVPRRERSLTHLWASLMRRHVAFLQCRDRSKVHPGPVLKVCCQN